jgi:IS1 family transposase
MVCDSDKIVKNGTQSNGNQRLMCKECGRSFQAEYTNNGAKLETKFMIIKMSLNGSGIRDISRVLEISPNTVIDVLKKTKDLLVCINPKYLNHNGTLKIRLEMDEMWGRVYCKDTPCWLWHAINHDTGDVVAFVLGTREKEMCKKLWDAIMSLEKVEVEVVYSDDNWAYHDVIPKAILQTGKRNTQKIERKHLTYRTRLKRLARKTICYSKTIEMHIIMISMLINVLEFGRQLL